MYLLFGFILVFDDIGKRKHRKETALGNFNIHKSEIANPSWAKVVIHVLTFSVRKEAAQQWDSNGLVWSMKMASLVNYAKSRSNSSMFNPKEVWHPLQWIYYGYAGVVVSIVRDWVQVGRKTFELYDSTICCVRFGREGGIMCVMGQRLRAWRKTP